MYFSHCVYLFSILNILCDGRSTSITPVPTCVPDNSHTDRWSQEDFPNPQIDISKCGRNCKASWICDPGHILSSDGADQLDYLISTVQRSGLCKCSRCSYSDGYNISVALVPAMDIYPGSDGTLAARRFATYIKDKWSFQKCDNDIVIFISRDDRKVYTMAGATSYETLTLKCIEVVYNRVRPTLSTGRYQDALEAMIKDYKSILYKGNCDHISEDESNNTVAIVLGSIFGVLGFGLIIFIICKCRSGGCSGGGGSSGGHRSHHHSFFGGSSSGGGGGWGFSGGDSGGGGGGGGGDF